MPSLRFILDVPEPLIQSFLSQQFKVRPSLADGPILQHKDLVGVLYGGELMSDHDDCFVFQKFAQSLLYLHFILHIHVRRHFIEQNDGSVFNKRTGNSQSLFFSAGELRPTLAQNRVIPAFHLHYELVTAGAFGCGYNLLHTSRRFSDPQVIENRILEQDGILENKAETFQKIVVGECLERFSSDTDITPLRLPKASQQVDDCRFSTAGQTYQRRCRFLRYRESNIFQDRSMAVGKGDTFVRDVKILG